MANKQELSPNSLPPDLSFNPDSNLWAQSFLSALALHVYTERYVNKGAYHSYRHYSEVSQKYRPLDGAPSFLLPYVVIPEKEVRVYQCNPNSSLKDEILGLAGVRFFLHPDMIPEYEKQGVKEFSRRSIRGHVEVVPTSSTRTMFAKVADTLSMIKVDLSGKRLGRLTRQLPERSVIRSNFVATLIADILKAEGLPDQMAYYPETLGIGISIGNNSFANLHRECSVLPEESGTKYTIPVFSLYSPDCNNPGNPLIIQQLIKLSGLSPETFFEQMIVRPMIRNVMIMAFKYGLLLEAHPQNTLVELDDQFQISRYRYRDLQTVIVDLETREKSGLETHPPEGAKLLAAWQADLDPFKEYSIFYDHRIAYQTIEEIIIVLVAQYPCHIALLQGIVRRVFNEVMDELNINKDAYFPKDYYYLYRDGMTQNNVMELQRYNEPPYR